MKTKHLLEQHDRYNQRLALSAELPNGEPLNLNQYVRGLVSTQSLEAWRGNDDGLRDWIATCVAGYIKCAHVKIYGYGN